MGRHLAGCHVKVRCYCQAGQTIAIEEGRKRIIKKENVRVRREEEKEKENVRAPVLPLALSLVHMELACLCNRPSHAI